MDIEEEGAKNWKFYGQNKKTFGGYSETKPTTTEVDAVENRRFSNLGRPMSNVLEKLK